MLALLLSLVTPDHAQGTSKVAAVCGQVEHKTLRTGRGASLTLDLPDGAFMIANEHSILTIQEPDGLSFKNLINAVLGKVRFYIQRPGGKSKPRGAGTVTAVIAVRG